MAIASVIPQTGGGPIRITHVISTIASEHAGTEGHLLRLLRGLDREQFAPRLVVMQRTDWADEFDDPRIPLHVLGFRSFRRPQDWLAISKLSKLFKKDQTQIVELHSPDAHFAGAIAARMANVPVVISCRRNSGYQYSPKVKLQMRLGNRYVTSFMANASIVADEMSRMEGVNRDRYDVINNGIDLVAFDDQAANEVPGFERMVGGRRVISIAANLRPVKNIGCFLHAAKKVAGKFDDVVFVIMGDGSQKTGLQQQAERLGIADKVIWTGSVPSVAPYVIRSHVACLTSDSEGLSNAIIEYMAAGLPVVATNVGGTSEAIVDGITGFVVPPNDPESLAQRISHVLQMDEAARKQMSQAARLRVEKHFTMQCQLDAHQSLYARELKLVIS